VEPDHAYERAVAELIGRAYADGTFRAELDELLAAVVPAGQSKAAGLALLRLTSPGVPDTYQGTEVEQLTMVDPDNRRPVAFQPDDSLKYLVTRITLRLRAARPELFTGYRPLAAPRPLVAFARGTDQLAVVVTCLGTPGRELGAVELPGGPWRDLLSGAAVQGGPTQAHELTALHPHALLVRN
jgi:(1->4)-alpha-D-glucan 1-alpha-D-glucosylmutase